MAKILRSLMAVAVITFVFAVQPARAAQRGDAYTVTFAIVPGVGACAGNVSVEAHGTGQTAQGAMFITVKKCFFPPAGTIPGTYAGTFALCPSDPACTPDSEDAVSGTYAGVQENNVSDFAGVIFGPFHGTLTINRDNGHYGWAKGTIDFTAIAARLVPTGLPTMGTAYYILRPQRGND